MKKTIAYDGILQPQEYLKLMLDQDINLEGNNQTEQIENLLDKEYGEGVFWSYRFDEIDHIIEMGLTVILVEVNDPIDFEDLYILTPLKQKKHYRWFEVDETIDVEKELKKMSTGQKPIL